VGGGKTLHTDGSGKVGLDGMAHRAAMHVTASGYTPTTFHVP
jgi:hypothetical protein